MICLRDTHTLASERRGWGVFEDILFDTEYVLDLWLCFDSVILLVQLTQISATLS